jgi:hypothetical protein
MIIYKRTNLVLYIYINKIFITAKQLPLVGKMDLIIRNDEIFLFFGDTQKK